MLALKPSRDSSPDTFCGSSGENATSCESDVVIVTGTGIRRQPDADQRLLREPKIFESENLHEK